MKKLLMMVLALSITVCGALGIAACGRETIVPEQNQGQVEQNDGTDKNQGNIKEKDSGESGSDEKVPENENHEGESEEKTPPHTPEEGKPGTDPEESQDPTDSEKEEEKGDEEKGDEEPSSPDPDEPQGDEPSVGEDESQEGEQKEEEKKPSDKEQGESGKPQTPTTPDKDKKPSTPSEQKPSTPSEQKPTNPSEQKPSTPSEEQKPDDSDKDKEEDKGDTEEDKGHEDVGGEEEKGDKEGEKPGEDEKQEEEKPCEHVWTYSTGYGTDRNNSRHMATCTICGVKTPQDCKFGEGRKVDPTCTEDGYTSYTCTICGFELQSHSWANGMRTDLKLGHKYSDTWTPVSDSDMHKKVCELCGDVQEAKCTINVTTTAATCTTAGSEKKTCTLCGREEEKAIEALGHDMTEWKRVDNSKNHEQHCKRANCSESKTEACQETVTNIPGTCETKGSRVTECAICHYKKVENGVGGLGHDYSVSNICKVCHKDGLSYSVGRNTKSGIVGYITKNEVSQTITTLHIPEKFGSFTIERILASAFSGNKNLKEVYIPKNITWIDEGAFSGCDALVTVNYEGTSEEWKKINDKDDKNSTYKEDKLAGKDVNMQVSRPEDIKTESKANTVALPAERKRVGE